MSKFQYRRPTAEQLAKRAQGSRREGFVSREVKLFRPHPGSNYIRILPGTWEDADHFGYDVWIHRNVGADNATVLCLQKMKGKKCPVCEEALRAIKAKEDEDYIKALQPERRVLFYLIDREKESEGVQMWSVSGRMDEDLAALAIDKRTNEVFPLDDPKEGYDLEFEREGEGLKTRYKALRLARRPSKLGNREWLEWAIEHPIPDMLIFRKYDEIAEMLMGASKEEDDDEEESSKPSPTASRRKYSDEEDEDDVRVDDEDEDLSEDEDEEEPRARRSRSRDDEDDDEDEEEKEFDSGEDDDDDDDLEEEDDRPSRSKRLSRDEDDEDEEEEAEEDEDEAPRSRKHRSEDEDEDLGDEDEEEDAPKSKKVRRRF